MERGLIEDQGVGGKVTLKRYIQEIGLYVEWNDLAQERNMVMKLRVPHQTANVRVM
jgi:hypothetical protein